MIYRATNAKTPILPRNLENPVGGTWILRKADKAVDERFKAIQVRVLALFRGIPAYKVNISAEEVGQYVYGLTPAQMEILSQSLQDAIEYYLANPDKRQFFMAEHVEDATRAGTVASQANLAHLSVTYAAARPIETIILSQPYVNRVAMAVSASYDKWSSFSAAMKDDLRGIIGRSVALGLNPKKIQTQIAEQLGVSRRKAWSIAQTELVGALREARWAESDVASQELDLDIRMLWTSALIPQTRPWHASRHGKAYTTAEVRAFYAEKRNMYNCFCAQTECFVDADGKPVISKAGQQAMKAEKQKWEKAH